jgi:predicted chitinase
MTTAPKEATTLLIVADPDNNLNANGDSDPILALSAHLDDLSAGQLRTAMPGLKGDDARRYAAPLDQVMAEFNFTSLESRAMFLGQLAHESNNLQTWSEKYNGDAYSYFVSKYWLSKGQWTHGAGSPGPGPSVPDQSGITLNVPHGKGAHHKTYAIYWAQGPSLDDAATFYRALVFTFANGYYSAHFRGAVPPKYTTYLLIVDPANSKVVQAISNELGNWSPQDASNFRGQGPIHLTGRYNYQKFADFAQLPVLMTEPWLLEDKKNHPLLGLRAAGWYWEDFKGLNEVTDTSAGSQPYQFTKAITVAINPNEIRYPNRDHIKATTDRMTRYLRIRALFLDENF